MNINAGLYDFKELNEQIRNAKSDLVIQNCLGHRVYCGGSGPSQY